MSRKQWPRYKLYHAKHLEISNRSTSKERLIVALPMNIKKYLLENVCLRSMSNYPIEVGRNQYVF